jgi:ArsR family transcriptional regulator
MAVPRSAALQVGPVVTLFKALADETRLRIVALLAHGELCVCHVESALALSQPNVSRHLGILRAAGVVEARRLGSWVHYRLVRQDDPDRRRQLQALVRSFAARDVLRADVARLLATKGPRSCR